MRVRPLSETFAITGSRPHAGIAAVPGNYRAVGPARFARAPPLPHQPRALGLIAARIPEPGSRVGTARALNAEACRNLKNANPQLRPIRYRLPDRVRAHPLIRLLAYCVEWYMGRALAPALFDREQWDASRPPST